MATIDYRLTTEAVKWGGAVTWPAQLHDVKAGVRWLRAHAAELKIDHTFFVSFGPSAGGHISAMLAATSGGLYEAMEGCLGGHRNVSSHVMLSINFCGPTQFETLQKDTTLASLIKHEAWYSPESVLLGFPVSMLRTNPICGHLASPIWFFDKGSSRVPVFTAHGILDDVVPCTQSMRLHDALSRAGVASKLVLLPTVHHCLDSPWEKISRDRMKNASLQVVARWVWAQRISWRSRQAHVPTLSRGAFSSAEKYILHRDMCKDPRLCPRLLG